LAQIAQSSDKNTAKGTDNSWETVKEYGEIEEQKIVSWLGTKWPALQAQWITEKNVADIQTIKGGIEVKSYRDPYRKPSIEVQCIDSGKYSVWYSDPTVKYVFVNHGHHIHVYDAKKLKELYQSGKLITYTAKVSQGNGKYKNMKFIYLGAQSSDKRQIYLEDRDQERWDCCDIEYGNPYIKTLQKDWSSFIK
jgi:hypothetical protein